MKLDSSVKPKPWYGAIVIVVGIFASGLCEYLGSNKRSEDAISYSAAVITAIALGIRPFWKLTRAWVDFLIFALAHAVVLSVLFRSFVPVDGVPAILLFAAGIAEIYVAVFFLWGRRFKQGEIH